MKARNWFGIWVGILGACLFCGRVSAASVEAGFNTPADSARPWVFWFWLDGNITSNGITADLEAMKRVGIAGVVIMEVEQGTPKGPVDFASEQWLRLFKHMCGEADRLGLKVSMNNDGGWTGSGGPWITPELSMQKLVWSETNVKGPTNFNAPLPQAVTVTKFYRDIAVMALSNTEADSPRMKDFSPRIKASVMGADFQQAKLLDGDAKTSIVLPRPEPAKPQYLQIEFDKPFSARRLTLALPGITRHKLCHTLLQTSDDGRRFNTVKEFDADASELSLNFNEVTSKFYRLFFTDCEWYLDKLVIAEVELTSLARIDNIEAKALFVPKREGDNSTNTITIPDELATKRERIVQLTKNVGRDGRL